MYNTQRTGVDAVEPHLVRSTNYVELEDNRLLESIANKDRGSLEALYARYSGPVYSLAMHLLRDPGASAEVTQDLLQRMASGKQLQIQPWQCLSMVVHHRPPQGDRRTSQASQKSDAHLVRRRYEPEADGVALR